MGVEWDRGEGTPVFGVTKPHRIPSCVQGLVANLILSAGMPPGVIRRSAGVSLQTLAARRWLAGHIQIPH